MTLLKKFTAKIPYSLVPDTLMEGYTGQLMDQINVNIELSDKNTEIQKQNEQLKKGAGELMTENHFLKSAVVGEARITMRSIRRANAMKWLFILAIGVLAAIAFIKRK